MLARADSTTEDGTLSTTPNDFETKRDEDLQKSADSFFDFSIGTPDSNNRNSGGSGRGSDPRTGGGGGGGGGTQWDMTRRKDYIAFEDVTNGKLPFGIENNSPDFSCFIASNGNVGLGTSYPQAKLHLVGDSTSIRLDDTGYGNNQPQTWDIAANDNGFNVYESTRDRRTLPFKISSGATSLSIAVSKDGNVGLGTDSPAAKLHVLGSTRIDGNLNVGPCSLDTKTCQWRRARRRSLRQNDDNNNKPPQDDPAAAADSADLLPEDEESRFYDQDEHDDESSMMLEYMQQLEQQNEQTMVAIKAMQSRMDALEETAAHEKEHLKERVQMLESEVAVLMEDEDEETAAIMV
ncbi:hypothetical protein ACA910_007656 [Epithemia clementina (nom. ined.)]